MDDKLTIVGPEPSGREGSVPARVNIEALLLMAKYDEVFRKLLLTDRRRAIDECGIDFSDAERRLLSSVPPGKLEAGIASFSIKGVSRDSLPDWKEAAAVVLLIMTMLVGSSCGTGQVRGIEADARPKKCVEPHSIDIEKIPEGWCDPDTFRLAAYAAPPTKETDPEKRKALSRKSAELSAKYRMLEKFIGARIEAGGIIADDAYMKQKQQERETLKKIIMTGEVIAEKWDNEQNCMVIFQLRRPGLKKMMESGLLPE